MTNETVPMIRLNNGVEVPQLGFGVFKIPPRETKAATLAALDIGYRHIDTAEMYGNERGVGDAVRESGLNRDEVFVTSKLNNGYHAYDDALGAFNRSLEELQLERLDLFLIHWPLARVTDYVETWRAMQEMYRSGRVRAIGVSNFHAHHLRRLFDETDVVPAVNQIEVHPFLTQEELRAFNVEHGIATEAWSPIARGLVVDEPVIRRIAKAHQRSAAQVTLRWHLQRGDIVFPKSVKRERMEENFRLFDFDLTPEEMADISALDRGQRTGPDPDAFSYVPR